MSAADRHVERLPEAARRLHRALIQAFIDQGAVQPAAQLAGEAGIAVADLPAHVRELAAADYLALNATGDISCLYPFSARPTPHVVLINGQPRFAMCAIDALGIPAMLNQSQTLAVAGKCAVCGAPIALTVRPGAIEAVSPPTALVVARRDEDEPAFAACCPFTVFACGQDHAEQFTRQIAGTHVLTLPEALTHAEKIFADLLAEDLPAHRPRGERWEASRDA
jgi:hypothetical protein